MEPHEQLRALADRVRELEADSRALRALAAELGLPVGATSEQIAEAARARFVAPPAIAPWTIEEIDGALVLCKAERAGNVLLAQKSTRPLVCSVCEAVVPANTQSWRGSGPARGVMPLGYRLRVCPGCVDRLRR